MGELIDALISMNVSGACFTNTSCGHGVCVNNSCLCDAGCSTVTTPCDDCPTTTDISVVVMTILLMGAIILLVCAGCKAYCDGRRRRNMPTQPPVADIGPSTLVLVNAWDLPAYNETHTPPPRYSATESVDRGDGDLSMVESRELRPSPPDYDTPAPRWSNEAGAINPTDEDLTDMSINSDE